MYGILINQSKALKDEKLKKKSRLKENKLISLLQIINWLWEDMFVIVHDCIFLG